MDEILAALENAPLKWKTITYLLMDTGCRRGEILGLKPENVDYDTGLVVIDHALLSTKSKGVYEGETKTGSMRAIRLAPQSLELLRKWKTEQLRMKLAQGDRWVDSGCIFTQDDGSRLHPDSITDWMGKFSKKHNLPHIHPHAFRHTAASTMIANGGIWSPLQTNSVMPTLQPPRPSTPIKLPLQKQRLQMSEPVCLQAEAPSPRKREHDVPNPKNPIVLQASILTRKVEEKFSKKFGFWHLQKSGFGREPQNEPWGILRG